MSILQPNLPLITTPPRRTELLMGAPPVVPPANSLVSRANVSQECITTYNELKLSKKYKYIIYKLSDDYKQIVVEDASDDKDWDNFREKLINATCKTRSVCPPAD